MRRRPGSLRSPVTSARPRATPLLVKSISAHLAHQPVRLLLQRPGETALARARHGDVGLILIDGVTPGGPGCRLCRWLRADCEKPNLMLTARQSEQDELAALAAGADDYVPVPVRRDLLCARLRVHLGSDSRRGPRMADLF